MKKTKIYFMTAAMILSALSLTACSKKEEPAATTVATTTIDATYEELGYATAEVTEPETTTEPETQETEAPAQEVTSGEKLVPEVPVNVAEDVPLGEFCYILNPADGTKEDYDISELTIKEVNGRRSGEPNLKVNADFYFNGEAFAVGMSSPTYYEFVKDGETCPKDDEFVPLEELGQCEIKGFAAKYTYGDDTKEAKYIFYNGISLKTDRRDIEEALGEGYALAGFESPTVAYNNGKVTMVITYRNVELTFRFEGDPETVDRVDTIYIIKNV